MAVSTFGLVHGAWHGGWAWDLLRAELEALGHRVIAPDLPCEDVDAGAAEYAGVVTDALDGDEQTVLVGHSLGGVTIPLVPARMRVYVCAYVPQPGRSVIDRGSDAFGLGFGSSTVRDDRARSYWPDPETAARDLQYPAAFGALAKRLRRQARRPSIEPSPVDRLHEAPSAYIVCSRDRAIPPSWQRQVAHAELGVQPVELESGHSPMLSCPRELAAILDRLAAQPVAGARSFTRTINDIEIGRSTGGWT